ncbi:MAG: efflux RND transporter periplasmic adaptor subunit [Deltaproteobacteria bacterium]|nr:efflux RND transporter periplasmic adaptor subunit [Deltaproteobacteria bacterium]
MLLLLAACRPAETPHVEAIRPVRAIAVERRTGGELVSLTGTIQAEAEVNLAFRIDGRMIARPVNVGDQLRAGQLVAELDPENEQSALRAARAGLSAARGQLVEARANFERFRTLVEQGVVSRAEFERTTQIFQTAQAQADAAQAQVTIAENRLRYTKLYADAPGAVTAVGAEPGEVVQAGRMIAQLTRADGRDAVFNVPANIKDAAPADPTITVALTMDPTVDAIGRVREVAPRADPVTGTWQVRVGLTDAPAAMRLGTTVTGRMQVGGAEGVDIPAAALTRSDGKPAVWVIDPTAHTVALRQVEVLRFDPAGVLIGQGLEPGEMVVTAGVQALFPGQKVRVLGAAS